MARNRGVLYPQGTTHADELARHFPPKWLSRGNVLTTVLVLVTAVALVFLLVSSRDTSFTGVKGQVETAPASSQVQPVESQPASAVPVVVKEWPKIEVRWREIPSVPGTSLIAPMQSDGFYTGATPSDGITTPEGLAFIATILPQLKEGGMVAAARDKVDKNIVFVSITGYDHRSYFFISLDGEKSWREINPAPLEASVAGSHGVRVSAEGNSVHLVARDNTVAEKWWAAAIQRE